MDEEDQVMQKVKKKPRVASYDMLLAMEHVLDAIGDHQLESFLPKDKTDEESKVSILDAPTLVTLTDCGSDCFCPMWFALSHLKMRLWHFPDPRHRLVREEANAAQHSGLRGCLALSDVILQFFLGPWEEHKWWQVVKEETSQYLNMARLAAKAGENHEGNALVRHLLPKIAQEQGWVENETTLERVHEALSEALFLRRRGTSGNSSRWNEFHWSFGERRKEFSLLLLILVSYGINMGYVQQADAPVLTSLQTQAQRASNRASEAKTLKEAKQRIGAFFSRCQNKLHVATVCLSSDSLMEQLHIWYFASSPLCRELDHVRKHVRGQMATRDYYVNLATGQHLEWTTRTCEVLQCVESLQGCGIFVCSEDIPVYLRNFTASFTTEDPVVIQQDSLVKKLGETILHILHFKLLNLSHHLVAYPMRFALLLPNDETLVKEELQKMKKLWKAWSTAQEAGGKWWKAYCN